MSGVPPEFQLSNPAPEMCIRDRRYNTDKGVWYQYDQKFDAALLKQGANEMTFTVPAGDVTTGVVWDYVRLELNDGSKAYPTPPDNQRPDYPTLE